jgi:type II secretory pathway component PulJ
MTRPRRGFSLVEVLVMCSVGSLLLMLAIQLLHTSLVLSRIAKTELDNNRVLSRIERDLRRDVAFGTELLLGDSGDLQILSEGQPSSRWQLAGPSQLLRIRSDGDGSASRERFELTDNYRIELQQDPNNSLLMLVRSRPPGIESAESKLERVIQLGIVGAKGSAQ